MTLAEKIASVLPRYRYRFARETDLHDGIAQVLAANSIAYVHEFVAGPKDRFDFICGRVVIEAKIKGSAAEALQQVDRYCAREDVDAVVLVSTRRWSVEPKIELQGKPVYVVKLGSGL